MVMVCTTLSMYKAPLNCTLKMGKMGTFMLCIFYHDKNIFKSNTIHHINRKYRYDQLNGYRESILKNLISIHEKN